MMVTVSFFERLRIAYTAFRVPAYTLLAYQILNDKIKSQKTEQSILETVFEDPDGEKE